jgi:DNA processing protein
MAVPGKIDSPLSKGSNDLIKKGARLVDCVEDVMEALGYVGQQLASHAASAAADAEQQVEKSLFDEAKLQLTEDEDLILKSLSKEPSQIEDVIAQTGLGAGRVSSGLVGLQLKGIVRQLAGNVFVRR